MAKVFKKVIDLLVGSEDTGATLRLPKKRLHKGTSQRELIQRESKIGSQLFGAVPVGHRREFFCLDKSTWIWYEESVDPVNGNKTAVTTRYEIQPHGILKAQEGAQYTYLEGEELQNLRIAIRMYYEEIARQVYQRDPLTGRKLVAQA
jgi:hypothetical protein